MIKKFCDRCGKEIVGEPWYMRWYQNTMSGLGMGAAMVYSSLCSRADSVDSYSNAVSQSGVPMYCDECRMAILAFAAKNPEQEEAEVRVSPDELIDIASVAAAYCRDGVCETCVFQQGGECMIAGDRYLGVDEIVALVLSKFREKNGGKK